MAAKFCGSGGAIVIIPGFSYEEAIYEALRLYEYFYIITCREMESNQFTLVKVNSMTN